MAETGLYLFLAIIVIIIVLMIGGGLVAMMGEVARTTQTFSETFIGVAGVPTTLNNDISFVVNLYLLNQTSVTNSTLLSGCPSGHNFTLTNPYGVTSNLSVSHSTTDSGCSVYVNDNFIGLLSTNPVDTYSLSSGILVDGLNEVEYAQ